MTIRDIAIAFGYEVDKQSEKSVEQSISTLKNSATKLLGAIGVGFSLTAIKSILEEFDAANVKIAAATEGLGKQKDIQQELLKTANATKTSYAETSKTVTGLLNANKEIFTTVEEAAEYTTIMTRYFKGYGKDAATIQSLMESINKSFVKGALDSSTMNSMLDKAPEAVTLLSEYLGVSTDRLQGLVAKGRISMVDFQNAFLNSADKINERFENLNFGISDALNHVRNTWGLWLDDIDKTYKITDTIGKFIVRAFDRIIRGLNRLRAFIDRVADSVGGMDKLVKLVGLAFGALFVAMNMDKIMTFLKGFSGILGTINLKTLALAASFLLVFLAIEDLYNFLKGNDSLLGTVLEQQGIDATEFRDNINSALDGVKEAFGGLGDAMGEGGANLGGTLLSTIAQLLPVFANLLVSMLPLVVTIIGVITDIISTLANVSSDGMNVEDAEQFSKSIESFVGQLSEIIGKGGDLIADGLPIFMDILGKLAGMLMNAGTGALDIIAKLLDEAGPRLDTLPINDLLSDDVIGGITGLIDSIIDLTIELLILIFDLYDATGGLREVKIDVIKEFFNTAIEMINTIVDGISSLTGAMKNLFGGGLEIKKVDSGGLFGYSIGPSTKDVSDATSGGSSGDTTVNQSVEINNEFNGYTPQDGAAMSDAQRGATYDITSDLYEAVSYGR